MTPGDSASPQTAENPLRRMEKYLSALLRTGVAISIVFLLGGVLSMLIHHPDYLTDRSALAQLRTPGAARPPYSVTMLIADLRQVRGRAIMTLGLLVLIATPVV
ncbi:MAG: DUF1634 domain-containing protein, partial [Phycisphaerae bacterium]|nr:DUF1634 domain-containing protein [Phycisphaerae bacterium]